MKTTWSCNFELVFRGVTSSVMSRKMGVAALIMKRNHGSLELLLSLDVQSLFFITVLFTTKLLLQTSPMQCELLGSL